MRLDPKAMAFSLGLLAGGMLLFVSVANRAFPGYGLALLELMGSVYPGYNAGNSMSDILIGTLYAVADGAIAGFLLAWLYNRVASA